MEKLMELVAKYGTVVVSALLVIAGVFKLKKKAFNLGDKIGDKIEETTSESTREKIAEYIENFAEGLKGESHDGDSNLVNNAQIDNALEKIKIDLGLEE